jgi:hypothetical protein
LPDGFVREFMKKENILFLTVLLSTIIPQLGVIWAILSWRKWQSGKRLFAESLILWIGWVFSTVLTFIFIGATEQLTSYPTVKSMFLLHSRRLAVLSFVYVGALAGILFLLKRYRKTKIISPSVWQTSFILSISTLTAFYALVFTSFYVLKYFFGEF